LWAYSLVPLTLRESVVTLDVNGGAAVGVFFAFVGTLSGQAFEFAGASGEGPGAGDGGGAPSLAVAVPWLRTKYLSPLAIVPHSTPRALVTVPAVIDRGGDSYLLDGEKDLESC
jgi:hypothetical protein